MSSPFRVVIVVLVIAAAGAAFIRWRRQSAPQSARPVVTRPTPAPTTASSTPPARVAILHPVAPAGASLPGGLPVLEHSDAYLRNALGELLGRKAVQAFLNIDDLARRVVATVNNLASDNAAAEMWPVKRTAGRFLIEAGTGGDNVIAARNADRYSPFVRLVEGVDTGRAVALYVRFYPLFQRAYEELGFPDKYLNDRVVEVIDHLLATPDPPGPIKVKLVTTQGTAAAAASSTGIAGAAGELYVFEDPALETSSAGQKLLLRIGRENAAKLKAKLVEARQRLATGSMARPVGGR